MKTTLFYIIFFALIVASCEDNSIDGPLDSSGTGKSGSMARFTISGNHLYAVLPSELSIFDISNGEIPEKVNNIELNSFVETIFPKDTLLFFGTRTGMLIYDNSNPSQPVFLSEYRHIYSCDPVVVSKSYAFVTLNSNSSQCGRNSNLLDIIDISDLSGPKQVAEYDMSSPLGLGVDKNMLFVCDNGLKAFDISDVENIELVKKFEIYGRDVIPDNGYLIMVGDAGFTQYQYTEGNIKLISSIPID